MELKKMACNCSTYINCANATIPNGDLNRSFNANFTHTMNHQIDCTGLPFSFFDKTIRTFSLTAADSQNSSGGITHILEGCGDELKICKGTGTSGESLSSRIKEDYVREINIPYYIDHLNEIYVYKYTKEELKFDVAGNGKARFRTRTPGDTTVWHKMLIPNTVTTKGTEKFIVVRNGVETILATQEYEYNPFPYNDMAGGIWGLEGGVIPFDKFGSDAGYTPDIAQVIVYPNPPKLAIPYDPDVIHYGKYGMFYDYNAIADEFVETSLPRDDGGKDYFYPYWLRHLTNKVWRATADIRYEAIYGRKSGVTFDGTVSWTPDIPEGYSLPFGSFAIDNNEDFVYSCLCKFSDRANGGGVIANYSSFGDLRKAIYTDNNIPVGKFHDYYPVAPL